MPGLLGPTNPVPGYDTQPVRIQTPPATDTSIQNVINTGVVTRPDNRTDRQDNNDSAGSQATRYESNFMTFLQRLRSSQNLSETVMRILQYRGTEVSSGIRAGFAKEISEFLEFTGGIYHIKNLKSKVSDMIEKTGLTPEKHKKIGALSRGYKQRVGIAQALIHDPEVLILDEPTTGLDPNQLVEIRSLIRTYGKDKTVLLSTHIMQEVSAMCDHVVIINKGVLVADEPVKNLPNLAKAKGIKCADHLDAAAMEELFQVLTK